MITCPLSIFSSSVPWLSRGSQLAPDEARPKLFSVIQKYAVAHIVSEELADLRTHKIPPLSSLRWVEGIFQSGTWTPIQSGPWLLRSFPSDRVWCVGAVAGFCAILPVLGFAHPSLRTSVFSSEASLSSGNANSLLGCPIHIKKSSHFHFGDPSTKTLPSGHHGYDSHACCIQAYSAAALVFRMFLSCGQRVELEWMDVVFHYLAKPSSDTVSKSL